MKELRNGIRIVCLLTFLHIYLQYLVEGQQQQQQQQQQSGSESVGNSATTRRIDPRVDFGGSSDEESGFQNQTTSVGGTRTGNRRDRYDPVTGKRLKSTNGSRRGQGHDLSDEDRDELEKEDDDDEEDDEIERGRDKKRNKSRPKIHGVRVTVDTSGDGERDTSEKKKHKETRENVEISDLGPSKKRVGIHTDITFEISADGEGGKGNRSVSGTKYGEHEEDASVPVIRGRPDSHKSRKPVWTPTVLNGQHRHYYDESGYDLEHNYPGTYYSSGQSHKRPSYPGYNAGNIPVYKSVSGGGGGGGGGSIYRSREDDYLSSRSAFSGGSTSENYGGRRNNGWSSYTPRYWTTERPYHSDGGSLYSVAVGSGGRSPSYLSSAYNPSPHTQQSNTISGYQNRRNWKPCVCIGNSNEYRRRRENRPSNVAVKSASSLIEIVNGQYLSKGRANLPENLL